MALWMRTWFSNDQRTTHDVVESLVFDVIYRSRGHDETKWEGEEALGCCETGRGRRNETHGGRREAGALYRGISRRALRSTASGSGSGYVDDLSGEGVTGRPRQTTRLSKKDSCRIRQPSPSTEPYLGDTHRPSLRKLRIPLFSRQNQTPGRHPQRLQS